MFEEWKKEFVNFGLVKILVLLILICVITFLSFRASPQEKNKELTPEEKQEIVNLLKSGEIEVSDNNKEEIIKDLLSIFAFENSENKDKPKVLVFERRKSKNY